MSEQSRGPLRAGELTIRQTESFDAAKPINLDHYKDPASLHYQIIKYIVGQHGNVANNSLNIPFTGTYIDQQKHGLIAPILANFKALGLIQDFDLQQNDTTVKAVLSFENYADISALKELTPTIAQNIQQSSEQGNQSANPQTYVIETAGHEMALKTEQLRVISINILQYIEDGIEAAAPANGGSIVIDQQLILQADTDLQALSDYIEQALFNTGITASMHIYDIDLGDTPDTQTISYEVEMSSIKQGQDIAHLTRDSIKQLRGNDRGAALIH